MIVTDRYLTEAAADFGHSRSELREVAEILEAAIQSNLTDHFESCRLSRGRDYWILEQSDGVWLAFTEHDLKEELQSADADVAFEKVRTVAWAYLLQFQARDLTIAIPGSVARHLEDPFFYPIFVTWPDGWEAGVEYTRQQFTELLNYYKFTPAEALDYWAVNEIGYEPYEWAGIRNVQAEAIRKNVRQAHDKLNDDERGATHANSQLRAVSVNDLPADGSVHDPEQNRFYIPTEDSEERDRRSTME